jgi:flagellar biosynthesis/type III secretory pathway protein FliH
MDEGTNPIAETEKKEVAGFSEMVPSAPAREAESFRPLRQFAYSGVPVYRRAAANDFAPLPAGGFTRARTLPEGDAQSAFTPIEFASPAEERRSDYMAEIEETRDREMANLRVLAGELAVREAALKSGSESLAEREKELRQALSDLEKQKSDWEETKRLIEEEKRDLDAEGRALDAIASKFAEMKKGFCYANADEIVEFALQLVEKIVLDRVVRDPSVIVRHIKSVVEEMKIDEPVVIYMGPDDLEKLKNSGQSEVKSLMENPRVKWLGDTRLKSGDLHIDTNRYRLDASLTTALKNLRLDLKAGETETRE